MAYHFKNIELFWQKQWKELNLFRAEDSFDKPKYYALDMFPYPSAAGLHVGHPVGYTATDICARYHRMKGFNVLHPMGWDAFGLPAEQHAIDTGEPPSRVTERCIENFKRQLHRLGFSYDWDREIATCDPNYYKWTQWIFTKLFEKGLAYQAEVAVNWCPALKTVLANEEVIDGKSERGGHPVVRTPMKQWVLNITSYADRLIADLDKLDWPESTKEIQRNWIGKSVGAKIRFALDPVVKPRDDSTVKPRDDSTIKPRDDSTIKPREDSARMSSRGLTTGSIEVFTTRQDTLDGVTFMVVAPEHPLLNSIVTAENKAAVEEYQKLASQKSDLARTELTKEKTGVCTGAYVLHPLTQKKLPVWVSDYVLISYGTGAVMAVPGHDERDKEFAEKFGLDIIQLDIAKDIDAAKEVVNVALVEKQIGEQCITYKLRDWIFSRQRYWGEPIPILKDKNGKSLRALGVDELPLTLPEVEIYEPTENGQGPLALISSWVQHAGEDGEMIYRETDTMPGSAGSSWYFLRYIDPLNKAVLADYEKLKYWMPIDFYIGGQEHAVGHLLYSRFWTKFLFDIGVCPVDEPFKKLVHQGMICRFGSKMSKSKGNGISPDDVVEQFGADALRTYLMFMGPLRQTKEWDDNNLAGVFKFLSRIERLFLNEANESLLNDEPAKPADYKALHKTIKKITEDIENLSFNTSISQMMIFLNHISESKCTNRALLAEFVKTLSPFAPHLAEELWCKCILQKNPLSDIGQDYKFVSQETWPTFDPKLVVDDEISIGVQVNGKHRGEITIPVGVTQDEAVAAAYENQNIKRTLADKKIKKVIFIKNRILNFVVVEEKKQ